MSEGLVLSAKHSSIRPAASVCLGRVLFASFSTGEPADHVARLTAQRKEGGPESQPLGAPLIGFAGVRREAEHFVECVRTGAPFRSSGEDTLADVRLFEEIYRVYLQRRGVL